MDKTQGELDSLTKAQIRELARTCPEIVPGVHGDIVTRAAQKTIFINILGTAKPGQGLVGRYLDSLPADFTIRVPNVMSKRFAGMLARRGYVVEGDEDSGSWVRRPKI
jgi:hypothetical protein